MIAQLAGHNLQRHVAIAKVIAGLRQHKGVIAAYDRNGFIGGDHFDELAAVFVAENIAAAQQQAARQQQARLTTIVKRDFYAALPARQSAG